MSRKRITVVSGLIINSNKEILMALRLNDGQAFPNEWEIPGGKVNTGETERGALVREMKEELGIDVEVGQLVSVASVYWGCSVNMLLYECTALGDKLPQPLTSQKLRFMKLDQSHGVVPCLPSLAMWYQDIAEHVISVEKGKSD